jgi:hypothetical protein
MIQLEASSPLEARFKVEAECLRHDGFCIALKVFPWNSRIAFMYALLSDGTGILCHFPVDFVPRNDQSALVAAFTATPSSARH